MGTRNSVPDLAINSPNTRDLNGRDCGNGVTNGHTDGYETQYCHLKSGSVAVQSGDIVERGAFLGFVGLSGNTEFPHLHFEVRKDGQTIDPFNTQSVPSCSAQTTLWEPNITVDHGGIISSGISTEIPEYSQILESLSHAVKLSPTPPALVSWVFLHNTLANDEINFEITSEDRVILSETLTLEKNQARSYRAVGRRAPLNPTEWKNGRYLSHVTILRDQKILARTTAAFQIGP